MEVDGTTIGPTGMFIAGLAIGASLVTDSL
jgi:hypothetical protein